MLFLLNGPKSVKRYLRQQKQKKSQSFSDPSLPIILATDATPYSVGAVMSHLYSDVTESPIQFVLQMLSSVQQGYAQIDKKAYAIIFGINFNITYLADLLFYWLITNHKFYHLQKAYPLLQLLEFNFTLYFYKFSIQNYI